MHNPHLFPTEPIFVRKYFIFRQLTIQVHILQSLIFVFIMLTIYNDLLG